MLQNNNGHFITKCSCGEIISQCRCPGPHPIKVVKDGCQQCQISVGVAKSVVDDVMSLITALKGCVEAMEYSQKIGCTEHLDCWEGSQEKWYGRIATAKALLEKYEKKETIN